MRKILSITFVFILMNLNAQEYNITSFGAKSDGKTLATEAIQTAIDKASKNGKGR